MGDSALVSITALFFPSPPPPLPPPLSEFGAPPPSTQCKLKLYKFSLSQSSPWKEGEGERQRERKGGSLEQRGGRHPTQGNWRLCLTYNTVIPLLFILSFHPLSPLPYPKMSTALVSPTIFELSEVLCKGNKMLNYSPSSVGGCLLDRKAVGTPAGGGFSRRHSVTLPNSKFHQNQLLSSLKGEPAPVLGPRESRFRDRSFSEGGERLLPQKQPGGQVNSSRYKTELCRPFEENGACKYGDKCQFAHGIHELRSLTRHPKYKTELCRTFHTIGFCPYGPRCHFIHNAEERRAVAGARDPAVADRPRLQHSFSFAGFPSSAANGLLDSPTSITPPPILSADDLLGSPTLPDCASNPFTFSSQELASLFAPSMGVQVPSGGSPTAFLFRPMSESPNMFDSPPSPQDSLSDQEGYLSSSSSSHSGSDSPILDTSRRLPIFSRLSISDD